MTRILHRDGRVETAAVPRAPRPGLPTIRGGPISPFPTVRLMSRGEIAMVGAVTLGAVAGVAVGLIVARLTID